MPRFLILIFFLTAGAVSLPPGEARGKGDRRAEAFARIAVEQAGAGDTAGAMESIALALEAAREEGKFSEAQIHVAWAQAKIGDLGGALETVERYWVGRDKGRRFLTFARIAMELDTQGRKAETEQVLGRIQDALKEIYVHKYYDFGEYALAAWLLAELGDVSGGLDVAESITGTEPRAAALMAVAEVQARAGDRDAVRRGVSRALAEVTAASGEAELEIVIPAALILAEAGDLDGAVDMAKGLASLELRAIGLAGIAAFRAGAGDAAAARAVVGQALALWDRRASMGMDAARVQGVSVDRVKPGGAAARAGLKAGDTILRFNGAEVSGPPWLDALVDETTAGTTVPVDFLRGGAQRTVNVTLNERASMGIKDSWYAYDTYGAGVYVSAISPGGAAARAGLKVGDTILRFNGAKVSNPSQFADLLDETTAGTTVPVEFRRGGAQRTVNVTLGERASMGIQGTRYAYGEGAYVSALAPGGAAARGGLKIGDTILRFNGVEILYLSQFTDLLDETTAGTTVPVEFRRGEKQHLTDVTLDRRSDDPDRLDRGDIKTLLFKILVAVALAGAGDPGGALEMVETPPSADDRALALAAVAVYLSVAGDAEMALAMARRVMAEAENISDPKPKGKAIGWAATALAEAGDLDGAQAALRLAGDNYDGEVWPLIAAAHLISGDARGAVDTLMSISSWWCLFFCSEGPRGSIELAVLQARAGLPADAVAAAKRISWVGDRDSIWAEANGIEAGPEAASPPEPPRYPSVAQAQALANPYERSVSLAKAAAGLAAAGDAAGALSTVDGARGLATALRDPSLRAWALGAVARAEQALGKPQAARDTLAAALESAGAESAPLYRAMVLIDLAEAARVQGDLKLVRKIAARAREAALQIPVPVKKPN